MTDFFKRYPLAAALGIVAMALAAVLALEFVAGASLKERVQATAASASAMAKGQFTLTGVTIAGETKIALLREKSSGRVVRVEQGKDVNGITVAKIEPEQVTLAQGGDQEVVPMLVSKTAPQAPVPVPPPTAAGPFAPVPGAAPAVPPPGANPAARPGQPAVAQPAPQAAQRDLPGQGVNALFGPRPGSALDPAAKQAAPLTPEELLARRRERRNQQTQ